MRDPFKNILRFQQLLSDGQSRTVYEIMEILQVSYPTVYNYIRSFEKCGYVIDKNNGRPKLVKQSPEGVELNQLVYFTTEEGLLLSHLLQELNDRNPLKQSLRCKLKAYLGAGHLPVLTGVEGAGRHVRVIAEAMERRRQVVIEHYHSGHSGAVSDRRVEPVQFSDNYRQVHAYDVEKGGMRTFVVSRMEGVKLTEESYRFEEYHQVPEIDCFWFGGEVVEEVTLGVDELALNLLHEEYPLSQRYLAEKLPKGSGSAGDQYRVTLPVRSLWGVGRFVMGLPGHCRVEEGKRLKAHIAELQKNN